MDNTRNAFGVSMRARERRKDILSLSYGRVVRAHNNHNLVIKLESSSIVEGLNVLNTTIVSHLHSWLCYSCVKEGRGRMCKEYDDTTKMTSQLVFWGNSRRRLKSWWHKWGLE